jgi:hypothetical protein
MSKGSISKKEIPTPEKGIRKNEEEEEEEDFVTDSVRKLLDTPSYNTS